MLGCLRFGFVLVGLTIAHAKTYGQEQEYDWVDPPVSSVNDRIEPEQNSDGHSNADAMLRHMRGAPNTPYSYSDPEIDRRLHQMTRVQGLPHD